MTGHLQRGVEPWDHDHVRAATIALAQSTERVPLLDAVEDPRPGAYLFFTSTGAPLWGQYGDGSACAYAGCCNSLRERAGRHRRTFTALRDLRAEDIWVAQLPTSTRGAALYLEDILIDALDPPLSSPALAGLGSRNPGRVRVVGRQSRFDDLCPGRAWAREPHVVDRAIAVAELAARVADPTMPIRWPPLR